jgi:hypothetical protein
VELFGNGRRRSTRGSGRTNYRFIGCDLWSGSAIWRETHRGGGAVIGTVVPWNVSRMSPDAAVDNEAVYGERKGRSNIAGGIAK